LMFNNQIYGLTKGQYSPTSEVAKVTKSDPVRIARHPVQPREPGPGRRGHVRGPHPRSWTGPTCRRRSAGPTSTTGRLRRGAPETATSSTTAPSRRSPARTCAPTCFIPLVHGQPIVFGARARSAAWRNDPTAAGDRPVGEAGPAALLGARREARRPRTGLRPVAPGSRPLRADTHRRLPGGRATRVRARRCPSKSWTRRRSAGWATSKRCLRSGSSWTVE